MSDLTAKFTALEDQLASEASTRQTTDDNIYALLGSMSDTLTTIQDNNATNARLILNAIGAGAACAPCPVPPLLGVPPVTDPGAINANWCQRVQAFLTVISLFCDYADALGTLSSAFTPGFVTGVIDEVRLATGDSGIPVPGWIDTLTIAADGVNFVVNRALLGGSLHGSFDPIRSDLQAALFAAGSADSVKSTYDTGIDSAPGLAASQPLLKQLGFSDLVNYFFDPSSTPVVSGFDGSACGLPAGCLVFTTADCITVTTEGGPSVIPNWEIYGIAIVSNPGHDNAVWIGGAWRGWSWTITDNGGAVYHTDVHSHQSGFDLTGTWSDAILESEIIAFVSGSTFALTFCPPGE